MFVAAYFLVAVLFSKSRAMLTDTFRALEMDVVPSQGRA
jgi:hypothetical protein